MNITDMCPVTTQLTGFMGNEFMIGPGFSESTSPVDSRLIFFGNPTKTWLMQQLIKEAHAQKKALPVYVCIDANYDKLNLEQMIQLFQKNPPTLTDGDIKTLFQPEPAPKKKSWVEMNEHYAQQSRRHRSKYKKR